MKNIVKVTSVVKKTGVFGKEGKSRYELDFEYSEQTGRKILVICLNPSSDNIHHCDTTTNYILNNLSIMGFSKITVCNLFACITPKLRPLEVGDGEDNREHIQDVLKREYDAILIGYGNSFVGNKRVEEEKQKLYEVLKPYSSKLVEIVDKGGRYKELKTIHPLFAGQRFSREWELQKHIMPRSRKKKGENNVTLS